MLGRESRSVNPEFRPSSGRNVTLPFLCLLHVSYPIPLLYMRIKILSRVKSLDTECELAIGSVGLLKFVTAHTDLHTEHFKMARTKNSQSAVSSVVVA
jgi:hypothetical protein